MSRNRQDDIRGEEAVARRLRNVLVRVAGTPPGEGPEAECPDAEQIAAYRQGSLAVNEAAKCEAHFAECARCREVLTLLGVTGEELLSVQSTAAAEAIAAAAGATRAAAHPKPPRPHLWRRLWLVPALAATGALAVFLVLLAPWRSQTRDNSPSLAAEALTGQRLQQALQQADRAAPPADAKPDIAPTDGAAIGRGAPLEGLKKAEPPPASREDSANLPARQALPNPQSELREAPAAAAAAPTAGAPRARDAAPPPSNQLETSVGAAASANAAAQPAPPPFAGSAGAAATAPDAPAAELARPEARAADRASARAPADSGLFEAYRAPVVIVRSPRPLQDRIASLAKSSSSSEVVWRAGAGGHIERSSDGGRTWQIQRSPLAEDWLAGSAASDSVCWLAGRHGAIARTADGSNWRQIAGPGPAIASEAAGKQPDWVGVTATDAQAATLTSASQAKYVTHDGGRTWQRQLP